MRICMRMRILHGTWQQLILSLPFRDLSSASGLIPAGSLVAGMPQPCELLWDWWCFGR